MGFMVAREVRATRPDTSISLSAIATSMLLRRMSATATFYGAKVEALAAADSLTVVARPGTALTQVEIEA